MAAKKGTRVAAISRKTFGGLRQRYPDACRSSPGGAGARGLVPSFDLHPRQSDPGGIYTCSLELCSKSASNTTVSFHPNEVLVAQLLLAMPSVGTQEPVLGNAEVQARHVNGQNFGPVGRQSVMPHEHGLGCGWVRGSGGNNYLIESQVARDLVGLKGIRPVGMPVRSRIPASANLGANMAVLVLE